MQFSYSSCYGRGRIFCADASDGSSCELRRRLKLKRRKIDATMGRRQVRLLNVALYAVAVAAMGGSLRGKS